MKYTHLAALIGSIYRTGRPAMHMSGQAYVNAGGPLQVLSKPWTQGEQA